MKNVLFKLLIILISCSFHACFYDSDTHNSVSKYTRVSATELQDVTIMPFDSLCITDPFIIADEKSQMYYITGSGGSLWKSRDLANWEGPLSYIEIDTSSWMGSNPMIWAPELHHYKGKYYCLATFTNSNIIIDTIPGRYNMLRRGTHLLISDNIEGPYRPMTEKLYLKEEWSTLDGTLWEEEGKPYLVFNHDWMQLVTGEIKYVPLSDDLTETIGEPKLLFSATDALWPREMQSIGELTFGMSLNGYVSDGPFLFKTETGRLGMLWSSWSNRRYAQGVAYSESGRLDGPWIHQTEPILNENSGHGMVFRTFEGKTLLSLHTQSLKENPGPRKPVLYEVDLTGDLLKIKGRYHP